MSEGRFERLFELRARQHLAHRAHRRHEHPPHDALHHLRAAGGVVEPHVSSHRYRPGLLPAKPPPLVVVGPCFLRGVSRIEWLDATEALPAFLIAIGIPLAYSISDGLALDLAVYPVFELLSGRPRELQWESLPLSATMFLYLLVLRSA